MKYPNTQPFSKKLAVERQSLAFTHNLKRRKADYVAMIGQTKIGTGKRDETGYHMPGSNKK